MKFDFPVEQTIKARYSVRTYEERAISKESKEKLMAYADGLSNPFGIPVSFRLLEKDGDENLEKLGTYGVIKGTKTFIGATVPDGEFALEALGYSFEKLILYATHLGLGTCWIAGTLNRSKFALAMDVKENELFPAVSALGYPTEKKRLTESLFRRGMKANKRKPWDTLFFKNDFTVELTEKDAGVYTLPLEMLRLAPSATNKQPWRIVQTNSGFHFYEEKAAGYGSMGGIDIQRVDLGIGACHFHLTALENGLKGRFEKLSNPEIAVPANTDYLFSWIPK